MKGEEAMDQDIRAVRDMSGCEGTSLLAGE